MKIAPRLQSRKMKLPATLAERNSNRNSCNKCVSLYALSTRLTEEGKKNARARTQNERIVVGAARMRTTALGTLNKIRNKLTRKMSCRYFECARALACSRIQERWVFRAEDANKLIIKCIRRSRLFLFLVFRCCVVLSPGWMPDHLRQTFLVIDGCALCTHTHKRGPTKSPEPNRNQFPLHTRSSAENKNRAGIIVIINTFEYVFR